MAAAAEDGTRSILDIAQIADAPDYCAAAPLTEDELEDVFGTKRPTRAQALESSELFEMVDRGQCRYVVLFEGGAPAELFFVGYSFD